MKLNLHLYFIFCLIPVMSPVFAYDGPSPLKDLVVNVSVKNNPSQSTYSYEYQIENPASNDGEISSIELFIGRDLNSDADYPTAGLSHCKRFAEDSVELIRGKRPFVAVGSKGPDHWSCGYAALKGYEEASYGWGATDAQYTIKAGTTMQGFILSSNALPGIRNVLIEPDIDLERLSPDVAEDYEHLSVLKEKVKWLGKTIGPKAAPKIFDASAFIRYVVSLKDESNAQGWISDLKLSKVLDSQLERIQKKIDAHQLIAAQALIRVFIKELETREKRNPSQKRSKKHFNEPHIRPEAVALLSYNGKYLLDQLDTGLKDCARKGHKHRLGREGHHR